MQKRCFSNLTGFLFLSLFILFCSIDSIKSQAADSRTLSAGTAKINITPKIPIPMSGYTGRKGPFKGVHDDLFARVIVFDDGENRAAIISADIIGFSNSFYAYREGGYEVQSSRAMPGAEKVIIENLLDMINGL